MSDEPRARSPRPVVALAALLAAAVAAGAVLAWFPKGASPVPTPPPRPSQFGEAARPRLEALRDRLVAGLLSLERPDGWPTRPRFENDAWARREATALAFAGLSAAKRTGSKAAGLGPALKAAREILSTPPRANAGSPPARPSRLVGLSATLLGFALGADPADASRLDRGASELAREADLGPFPDGLARAFATRAALAVIETGRGGAMGADPYRVVQVKAEPAKHDCDDPRVVEAFARAARAATDAERAWPEKVLASCVGLHSEWGDAQTDMDSWTMRAFLAGRLKAGDAWFAAILPQLEKAPDAAGVVQGDYYGDPTSRTAAALLILNEGWGDPPPR